ncbi:MAG TPA: MotA/TolQ/ExbB proton channel family protein [Bacteroidales bacterium]|nr:MotA/TolQ/ExbB proton channel family protein [Bacteroidales bacterium]
MKRLITFLALAALLTTGVFNQAYAYGQSDDQSVQTTQVTESRGFHQVLKDYFIQGGAGFMATILLCLIFGLAISIERTLYLNLSATNTKTLLNKIESALESSGIESAKEVCANTRGPVASIFYQGFTRYNEGLDMVEKSIVSYGSVLMGRMESGLSWIALFIAIAPMLGFLGTVIGMVQAFDAIEAAGDISPTLVAGGIKVALLTTLFGLIVAIILQLFYNYLVSKIDSIVNEMEDSSITFIDILSKHKK